MTRGRKAIIGFVACLALVWAGAAMAAKPVEEPPGGAAGELYDALETCQDNLGASLDLGTCSNALATCSNDLGMCAGALGTCPDDLDTCTGNLSTCNGNLSTCDGELSTCQGDLAACEAALTPATCGDGVLDPGEACDGSTPATCVELGFGGGELACAETCKLDTSGCLIARFVDTGLTVVDLLTGLEWEKKDDAGGLHDKDHTYTWSDTSPDPDGTAFTVFLHMMNNSCDGDEATPCTGDADCTGIGNGLCGHAGYRDWRLPEVDYHGGAKELNSLIDLSQSGPPYIFDEFNSVCAPECTVTTCSCTTSDDYWSSMSSYAYPLFAYSVDFLDGGLPGVSTKDYSYCVRAVRGPL
jgi:hypothetical protein